MRRERRVATRSGAVRSAGRPVGEGAPGRAGLGTASGQGGDRAAAQLTAGHGTSAGFDPGTTSVADRDRAKAAELGVSLRTIQIRRARYARQGLWGVVDQRAVREYDVTGRADARLVSGVWDLATGTPVGDPAHRANERRGGGGLHGARRPAGRGCAETGRSGGWCGGRRVFIQPG